MHTDINNDTESEQTTLETTLSSPKNKMVDIFEVMKSPKSPEAPIYRKIFAQEEARDKMISGMQTDELALSVQKNASMGFATSIVGVSEQTIGLESVKTVLNFDNNLFDECNETEDDVAIDGFGVEQSTQQKNATKLKNAKEPTMNEMVNGYPNSKKDPLKSKRVSKSLLNTNVLPTPGLIPLLSSIKHLKIPKLKDINDQFSTINMIEDTVNYDFG